MQQKMAKPTFTGNNMTVLSSEFENNSSVVIDKTYAFVCSFLGLGIGHVKPFMFPGTLHLLTVDRYS